MSSLREALQAMRDNGYPDSEFDDSMVEYDIECLPEHTRVRGNAMCSGDDDYDREVEDSIIADLEGGNDWAWCTVRVTARYDGIDNVVGEDYLGGCSYNGLSDFKRCGYYDDMKDQARRDLYTQLESLAIIARRAEGAV